MTHSQLHPVGRDRAIVSSVEKLRQGYPFLTNIHFHRYKIGLFLILGFYEVTRAKYRTYSIMSNVLVINISFQDIGGIHI